MREFNYTSWMQQNRVGPYSKALNEGDAPFDFNKSAIESATGDKISHTEEDDYGRPIYWSTKNPNVTYYINDDDQIIKYDGETGERYPIGDLKSYDDPDFDIEPDTDADYEEPRDDFDMAEGNDDIEVENSEEDDEVDKVIQKYESNLLKALAVRRSNPEDANAYYIVKKILETIASDLGLDSTLPFMENGYYSGDYSPKEALEYTKEMFHDWKSEQGPIDEAGNVKGIRIEIPGNSSAADFGKAAAREVVESFGPRDFRVFLQAFTEEITKLTSRL